MQTLVLGTANFGQRYGVQGKPELTQKEVDRMLVWASGKIDELDTSEDYKKSHKIISKHSFNFKITSKIDLNKIATANELTSRISQISQELKKLQVERILLRPHSSNNEVTLKAIKKLRELQEGSLIGEIGLTIYDTKELEYFSSEISGPLVFQVPISIINQSFEKLVRGNPRQYKHFKFYARSIFLQGLLLMEVTKIPSHLQEISPAILFLNNELERVGSSIPEATFSYLKRQEWIVGIIMGVSNLEELQRNVEIFHSSTVFDLELLDRLPSVPSKIRDPRLW